MTRALGRSGFTIIELMIVMVVLSVALLMMSSAVGSVSAQRVINRENALASDAVRSLIETMRNEDARLVFALFNADPSDDPAGPGTAPGHRFAVPGLAPAPGSPDGLIAEVRFPSVDIGPAGGPPDLELREDLEDASLGMPRDLNGDSIVDDIDHTEDYFVLPLEVRLRWTGRLGPREFRTFVTLCDYQWP